MNRLLNNGKMLVVPVDDSLIFGPYEGLYDIEHTIAEIEGKRSPDTRFEPKIIKMLEIP